MLLIRTVHFSPLRWSNQLWRLCLSEPSFPGGRGIRLLQFQRMDSFDNSANDQPGAMFVGSYSGSNEEYLHNRDGESDVIMVGSIKVPLKCMGHENNSSLPSSVSNCDNFEHVEIQKGTPKNVLNSDHGDEFSPVSDHGKRRIKTDLQWRRVSKSNSGNSRLNDLSSFNLESFPLKIEVDELSPPKQLEKKKELQKCQPGNVDSKDSVVSKDFPPFEPFNICPYRRRANINSRGFWNVKGGDSGKITKHVAEAKDNLVLRPGMVLLKHHFSPLEQVNIVTTCQELGLGPGGFYRPGYEDGAKLRLQMMCLGLDWDPQTRMYSDMRAIDGNKPPDIPPTFVAMAERTLKEAHALIRNESKTSNAEGILPLMSPDLCIVNFYLTSGRLGLHQDCDESKESLARGLPVVSFSVGSSAEFLYGDRRDVHRAEKIVLESGDVLIFGGESRHIYHGVSSIIPNSTPKFLLDCTGLRYGRLNLTFRKKVVFNQSR